MTRRRPTMPDPLLSQLESFAIDAPGAALSFTRRLAHENGWSHPFAESAVREYLRFVFLAMRAGHPVTPSPAVDEVWHLHLCYTRSYWDELCGKVLGRPLHHQPTRGGAAEDAKFRDQYARTLVSYRAQFGEPPADVWPPTEERFRVGLLRKVDPRVHWLVPKARVRRAAVGTPALLAVTLLASCTGGLRGTDWLLIAAPILVVIGLVALLRVKARKPKGRKRSGTGDDGSSIAAAAACGSGGKHSEGDDGGSGCGGGASGCGGGGGGCGD